MSQTRAMVQKHLPQPITISVIGYLTPLTKDIESIVKSGYYELCVEIKNDAVLNSGRINDIKL